MPVRYELITQPSLYRERLGQVSMLFSSVFERGFPASGWEQWYFGNPYGAPAVIMGYRGDELIAHSALIPQVLIKAGGQTPLSYRLSMSTMVAERHRHVSVFEGMMDRLHNWARAEGAGFVVGFPNANSYLPAKVLLGYQTLLETPFLSWTPAASRDRLTIANLPAVTGAPGECSYPADEVYWGWRMRNGKGGRVLLDGALELVYKVDGSVLTVLDLGARRADIEASGPLGAFARSRGANEVRLTEYHAVAAGIRGSELRSHAGYVVRLTACPLAGGLPKIRFSLLLSDVF